MRRVTPIVLLGFLMAGGAACRSASPSARPVAGSATSAPAPESARAPSSAAGPSASADPAAPEVPPGGPGDGAPQAPSTVDSENATEAAGDVAAAEDEEASGPANVQKEALDLCQAASDMLDRGETAEAIAAVDHAYELMLALPNNGDEAYLQAKEDIRLLVAELIRRAHRPSAAPAAQARSWDLALPIVNNEYVQREIRSFTNGERQFFLDAYERSGLYRPMILAKLEAAGLPSQLSWLPLVESAFKVRALSRASALGLWQFIASTGQRYGLSRDGWVDERLDPEKSTDAALAYLADLHALFGDWPKALAGYNCGEARVARLQRQKADQYLDFWDLFMQLPFETSRYVPRFIAALLIIEDPAKYGMTLPPPLSQANLSATAASERAVSLEKLDEALGIAKGTLQQLNPELRSGATPPRSYSLRVPVGLESAVPVAIASLPEWKRPVPLVNVHRVRSGETLGAIARRYRTSITAIQRLNHLRSVHRLRVGQRLRIPVRQR